MISLANKLEEDQIILMKKGSYWFDEKGNYTEVRRSNQYGRYSNFWLVNSDFYSIIKPYVTETFSWYNKIKIGEILSDKENIIFIQGEDNDVKIFFKEIEKNNKNKFIKRFRYLLNTSDGEKEIYVYPIEDELFLINDHFYCASTHKIAMEKYIALSKKVIYSFNFKEDIAIIE